MHPSQGPRRGSFRIEPFKLSPLRSTAGRLAHAARRDCHGCE